MSLLPPLPALEALDALERSGSVSEAARLCRLSQSAVSHKLRALESRLGFRLTEPSGRGVALTPQARRYLAAVRPGLAALREAHRGIGAVQGTLEISCVSGLAATWLAPRLGGFLNLFP
ncbi:LysR family transcriptional regulator, partial [Thioclava sp. BHET1]